MQVVIEKTKGIAEGRYVERVVGSGLYFTYYLALAAVYDTPEAALAVIEAIEGRPDYGFALVPVRVTAPVRGTIVRLT